MGKSSRELGPCFLFRPHLPTEKSTIQAPTTQHSTFLRQQQQQKRNIASVTAIHIHTSQLNNYSLYQLNQTCICSCTERRTWFEKIDSEIDINELTAHTHTYIHIYIIKALMILVLQKTPRNPRSHSIFHELNIYISNMAWTLA